MGSLPRVSVVTGPRRTIPAAPLTHHLAQWAKSDRVALLYSDECSRTRVTYAELLAKANSLAKAITTRARPASPNRDGDFVVAVCMHPSHHTITALLAIWKAGAAYVPIDPRFPQARITHILSDAGPALIIYDDTANLAIFAENGVPAVLFEDLVQDADVLSADEPRDLEVLSQLQANSMAIVMYTSGITGLPKGVRLPYSAICNRLWWQFHKFPYSDSEDTCVWKTALTFGDSVCEIWGPLVRGKTLLVMAKDTTRDPQKLVTLLSEYQVQRLVLVPTLFRSILMYLSMTPNQNSLLNLKLWICSGETLNKDLALQFFKYFGNSSGYKLANFYGSTEVMADITYYVMENVAQLDNYPTIPIGSPIDNCAVYLLDEEMNLAHESEPSQVWVAGANLATGYVGGLGTASFCDNPHAKNSEFGRLYRTGDYGTLREGVVLYAGRTDSQVKIRGHRVDLQDVDQTLNKVPGVDKCVVHCYGADRGNPEILAFITIQPEARITAHHIEATLKNTLPSYMIPHLIEVDDIPLLVSGKVDRQTLINMYENNNIDGFKVTSNIDYAGVEPEDLETARVLFETVAEVLGRAVRGALSVRADFYEVGGNSLNSIYTITMLRDKGYNIKISDFLKAINLGEVLSHITTNSVCEEDASIAQFTPGPMRDEHKQQVVDMIEVSFNDRSQLEQYIKQHNIKTWNYGHYIQTCWAPLIDAGLSIVLTDATGTPVAVALNIDARDESEIQLCGCLLKDMTLIESIEGPIRETMLPPGKGTVLHSIMMATSNSLSARDNVAAIRALENATLKVGQEKKFLGVFTTNTSPLTQQLCKDILGFETLLDYQINQFVNCYGEHVFGEAPDDMRAIVCWKPLT